MSKGRFAVLAVAFLLTGCSSITSDSSDDSAALRHMRLASSLERSGSYAQALTEYALVAERYRNSPVYQAAVRKAAILNCSPRIPTANDSTALAWFRTYLSLDLSSRDREHAMAFISLLQRLTTLKEQVAHKSATCDSLFAVSRRQSSELISKTRRLQEAESALNEANRTLKMMKEIDMQTRKRLENR